MTDEKQHRSCSCTGKTTATHYSYNECDKCGDPIGPVDATKNDDLRELIEKWREEGLPYSHVDEPSQGTAESACRQLEGLME